jgi:hypothetical protein
VTLSDPPAVSGDRVAFRANGGEVWTASPTGKAKRMVIAPDSRIPGGGGAVFQLTYGTFIQISVDTVVLVGAECFGCNTGLGLYTVPVGGGTKTRLVSVKQDRPDNPSEKFSRFGDDFHVNGDRVVFANAGRLYAVKLAGGAASYLAGGPAPPCVDEPYCGFGLGTLDALGGNVLTKASDGFSNARIVRRGNGGGLAEVVADKDTRPPDTPADYRFDPFHGSFDLPVIDRTADHRYSVFKGESVGDPGSVRVTGIYSRGMGGFQKLADTKTRVPKGPGRFAAFGFVDSGLRSLAAANGIVIFRGVDGQNRLGIYAVRAGGGPIAKVIAQGDPIDGTTVDTVEPRSLTFRREGFDGTTLVFFAQYAGNTGRGFFSTKIELPE